MWGRVPEWIVRGAGVMLGLALVWSGLQDLLLAKPLCVLTGR